MRIPTAKVPKKYGALISYSNSHTANSCYLLPLVLTNGKDVH
jgi:hypothetical protein